MPKGQYTRKPRKAAEATISDVPVYDGGAAPQEWSQVAGTEFQVRAADLSRDTEMDEIARLLIADPEKAAELAQQTDAQPEPPHKTFDSWMAEDDVPLPANDRVSQMVRAFGGRVCQGWHEATWLPADDGRSIEVTLVTPHGTSILTKDAGNWRESDIEAALEQMATDLRI